MTTYNGIEYNDRHGGPFDRGSADSYYGRGIDIHYYVGATAQSDRVEGKDMTPEQIVEYMAGYEYNEKFGDKKCYE
jgi:hypothetical protein